MSMFGTVEGLSFEEAATMLAKRPMIYFSKGGSERHAHFLLIKFGPAFFKDSFTEVALSLCTFKCPESLRVVLSWVRRDELIEYKQEWLMRALMTGKYNVVKPLVDSGVDFYPVLNTVESIPRFYKSGKHKHVEQTVMRRTHCKMTIKALLAVKKMGYIRDQDRFVIQKIALVVWTTRWSFDWNRARHPRPQFADRFFESPI